LIQVKPQFGKEGGKLASFTDQQFCEELRRVDTRFQELTGHKLDPFWRAPGGYTSPRTLAAGSACGYQHAGWAPAGYSGDELPSDKYPNAMLLKKPWRTCAAATFSLRTWASGRARIRGRRPTSMP
jgi:peptidoglycan/xylan/chitin deacetylase (PgdA/CDA1 family)